MTRPVCLLRLVQCSSPIVLVLSCERLRTAPLRALSPTGLLTAIVVLRCKARSRDERLNGEEFLGTSDAAGACSARSRSPRDRRARVRPERCRWREGSRSPAATAARRLDRAQLVCGSTRVSGRGGVGASGGPCVSIIDRTSSHIWQSSICRNWKNIHFIHDRNSSSTRSGMFGTAFCQNFANEKEGLSISAVDIALRVHMSGDTGTAPTLGKVSRSGIPLASLRTGKSGTFVNQRCRIA